MHINIGEALVYVEKDREQIKESGMRQCSYPK